MHDDEYEHRCDHHGGTTAIEETDTLASHLVDVLYEYHRLRRQVAAKRREFKVVLAAIEQREAMLRGCDCKSESEVVTHPEEGT